MIDFTNLNDIYHLAMIMAGLYLMIILTIFIVSYYKKNKRGKRK